MPKVSTFLWFNNQAEEAAKLYTSLIDNSKILKTVRIPGAGPDGNEVVQLVEFELAGQSYIGLNGGPVFTFNEAVSIVVNCDTQEELDRYWNGLTSNGGLEVECGWLKDKFGVSWQIIPSILPQLMGKGDPVKSMAMMGALRKMKKLDIEKLKEAYEKAGVPA